MKCGCSIYFFLNSANLICWSTDISKFSRGSLGLRDWESWLYRNYNINPSQNTPEIYKEWKSVPSSKRPPPPYSSSAAHYILLSPFKVGDCSIRSGSPLFVNSSQVMFRDKLSGLGLFNILTIFIINILMRQLTILTNFRLNKFYPYYILEESNLNFMYVRLCD